MTGVLPVCLSHKCQCSIVQYIYPNNIQTHSYCSVCPLSLVQRGVTWLTAADLYDSLAAFTPPHNQSCHEKCHQYGHHDKRPQDPIGWVVKQSSSQRAVMEVVPVHPNEKLIHQAVGPETVHFQSHQERAVRQFSVGPKKRNIG